MGSFWIFTTCLIVIWAEAYMSLRLIVIVSMRNNLLGSFFEYFVSNSCVVWVGYETFRKYSLDRKSMSVQQLWDIVVLPQSVYPTHSVWGWDVTSELSTSSAYPSCHCVYLIPWNCNPKQIIFIVAFSHDISLYFILATER